MIKVEGCCTECNDGKVKRLVSRKSSLCLPHYQKKKNAERKPGKSIKPISDKQKDILKEDQKMYRSIWRKRKHISELSGAALGDKLKPIFFSHILPKKGYPRFRHREDNIILLTPQEHHDWEFTDRKDPKFDKIKEKYEELQYLYNNQEEYKNYIIARKIQDENQDR